MKEEIVQRQPVFDVWRNRMAELLADVDLYKKDGSTKKGKEALEGKTVALYFSAHWCGPCREFTPILKDFYEELEEQNFEIVFISFDESEEELKEYLAEAHGDWYHIPQSSDKVEELSKKYDVSSIPTLIIIKADGSVITKTARTDVEKKSPKQALEAWQSA